jgi:hypothetical protein
VIEIIEQVCVTLATMSAARVTTSVPAHGEPARTAAAQIDTIPSRNAMVPRRARETVSTALHVH